MSTSQDARDFRNLTDGQYADVLNGRMSADEALAQVREDRQERAEKIARAALHRHADIRAERLNGRHALTIATAAALAALEEAESAR